MENFRANYGYHDVTKEKIIDRPEYSYLLNWVSNNQKVLDVGCGEGSLGYQLIQQKQCKVSGIDLSEQGVRVSIARGLDAKIHDLDERLPYGDKSFDLVVCNVTLQMVYRPGFLLEEMARVSNILLVSFPNFAFYKSRLQLLLQGKMPRSTLYGYHWHNTRHIHHLSIKDFKDFVKEKNWEIEDEVYFGSDSRSESFLSKLSPNLFAAEGIFKVTL